MRFKVCWCNPSCTSTLCSLQTYTEINDISEGILSDYLKAALETNLPKAGKKKTITLGVSERYGGSACVPALRLTPVQQLSWQHQGRIP
jgi:hypothetical protein